MTGYPRHSENHWTRLARDREFGLALLAGPAFWVWRAGGIPALSDKYQRVAPAAVLHGFYNAGFFATQGG